MPIFQFQVLALKIKALVKEALHSSKKLVDTPLSKPLVLVQRKYRLGRPHSTMDSVLGSHQRPRARFLASALRFINSAAA